MCNETPKVKEKTGGVEKRSRVKGKAASKGQTCSRELRPADIKSPSKIRDCYMIKQGGTPFDIVREMIVRRVIRTCGRKVRCPNQGGNFQTFAKGPNC